MGTFLVTRRWGRSSCAHGDVFGDAPLGTEFGRAVGDGVRELMGTEFGLQNDPVFGDAPLGTEFVSSWGRSSGSRMIRTIFGSFRRVSWCLEGRQPGPTAPAGGEL
jgi:hypothetical protein